MKILFLIAMLVAPRAVSPQAGITVSGRVNRSAAVPATAIERVVLAEANGTVAGETTISADGSFRFSRVRPGTFAVQVMPASSAINQESVVIQVLDRDVSGVQLAVHAMVTVNWALNVEGGGLRPPVTLSLTQYRGGQGYRLIALTDPSTPRAVAEGEYRVSWTSLPAGYFIKSVHMGGADGLASPLKIDGTKPPPQVDITLGVSSPPPWVKVSGKLVSVSPGPIPSALRIALEDSSSLRRTPESAVGPDGSFEFPMVLPGTYRPVTSGVASIQVMGPTSLVVPSNELSGLQILIAARKEISGKVTMEGGSSSSLPTILVIVANRVQSTVSVQPDGTFKITVPVGSTPFSLIAPGYTVRSVIYGASNLMQQPLTVGATDTAELRVTVAAIGAIDRDGIGIIIGPPVPLVPTIP